MIQQIDRVRSRIETIQYVANNASLHSVADDLKEIVGWADAILAILNEMESEIDS
jgi:hypothetical protein